MSLTSVVQALKIPEIQGLIKHVSNKGYYTESLNLRKIKEIYELREVVVGSQHQMIFDAVVFRNIHQHQASEK